MLYNRSIVTNFLLMKQFAIFGRRVFVRQTVLFLCAVTLTVLGTVYVFQQWQIANAVISDGANAVNVLGQLSSGTPNYDVGEQNGGPTSSGFSFVDAVEVDEKNQRLYVADQTNQRILVFDLNGSNVLDDYVADAVLGASDLFSMGTGNGSDGFSTVADMYFASSTDYLYVADEQNSRVLVFDVGTISNGEAAINVLGQPDFDTVNFAVNSSTLESPSGLAYSVAGELLFVSDQSQQRVLVFDVATVTDGEGAINVLGQTNFTSSSSGITSSTFDTPTGMHHVGASGTLWVADQANNRALLFDVSTITNGEGAINVLGQSDFISNNSNITQGGLNSPGDIEFRDSDGSLFIMDEGVPRVMVFDGSSVSDGMNADFVLGQIDFTDTNSGNSSSTFNSSVNGLAYNATADRLYVADSDNSRVMAWDVSTITNGEGAVNSIGQTSGGVGIFGKSGVNDGPNDFGFDSSQGVAVDTANNRLFVADNVNNRVLVFNLTPSNTLTDYEADNVLGQVNFTEQTSDTTDSTMNAPVGLAYDQANQMLYVGDTGNQRILVYDVSTIANGEAAANVLGATDFNSPGGGTTSSSFDNISSMSIDESNGRLFAVDQNNNRVLVFDINTLTDGEGAANVLGQSNFTSSTNATSSAGFDSPASVAYDSNNDQLFVADQGNNRVMVFDVSTIANGETAQNVLGQQDFSSVSSDTSSSTMDQPQSLLYDPDEERLFVGESGNLRVMVFDVATVTDGESAENVLGAPDFDSMGGGASQSTFDTPYNLAYASSSGRLFIADGDLNRVIVFDAAAANASTTVSVNSATVRADGSGVVDISVDIADPTDNDDARLRVDYAAQVGGSCGDDETFSGDPTLSEVSGNSSASVGSDPDVENDNTYQIGTVTAIETSATNTVQFDWNSATDVTSTAGNYCLRFTPYDTADGTIAYQSVALDNLVPTAPGKLTVTSSSTTSAVFTFGATTTETNFDDYRIHYRTGSSGVTSSDAALTSSTDSNLDSITYGGATTTTLTGLTPATQYVADIFAYDTFGNMASSTSGTSFYTAPNAPSSVAGTADSSTQITVTWAVNSNPSGTEFEADIDTGTDCSFTADLTSCVFTGLSASTQYTITVSARNGEQVEAAATAIQVTTAAVSTSGGSSSGGNLNRAGGAGSAPTISSEPGNAVRINGGAASTNNPTVRVSLSALNATEVAISETADFGASSFVPYEPIITHTFTGAAGTKTLHVRFRASNGRVTDASDTIELTVAGQEAPSAPGAEPSSTCSLAKGAYKVDGASAVYYVTDQCTKRPFNRSDVYFTYFDSWGALQIVSQDALAAVSDDVLGFMPWGPLWAPPYAPLVKTVYDPKVYIVSNGERRWIQTVEVFEALGYVLSWVEDVAQAWMDQYPVGNDVTSSETHPAGTLILYPDSPDVYLLETVDGVIKKRHIVDETVFTEGGFRFDRIITIPLTETYPDGEDIV